MHPRFISTSSVSLVVDGDFQHTQLVLLNIADRLCVHVCVQKYLRECAMMMVTIGEGSQGACLGIHISWTANILEIQSWDNKTEKIWSTGNNLQPLITTYHRSQMEMESSEKCLFVLTYHNYLHLNVNLQATTVI